MKNSARRITCRWLKAGIALMTYCTYVAGSIPLAQAIDSVESNKADFVEFHDAGGLQFSYDRSWKVEQHPDKDTLVKVSGRTPTGSDAEVSVSIMDNGMGLTPGAFLEILDKLLYAKIGKVSKVINGNVLVGKQERLRGYSEIASFAVHGIPMKQERLIIESKGKLVSFILTTGEWQFEQALPQWFRCVESIDGPPSLFTKVSASASAHLKPLRSGRSCAASTAYCAPIIIKKPQSNLSLDEKIKAVLPRNEEQRFLEIPWESNVLEARIRSQNANKPMFIWIMDGNVLGAT